MCSCSLFLFPHGNLSYYTFSFNSTVSLENLCRLLYVHQFDVARARLDIIPDKKFKDGSHAIMLRTLVTPVEACKSDTPEIFQLLAYELKRSKWLHPVTHDLVFMKYPARIRCNTSRSNYTFMSSYSSCISKNQCFGIFKYQYIRYNIQSTLY